MCKAFQGEKGVRDCGSLLLHDHEEEGTHNILGGPKIGIYIKTYVHVQFFPIKDAFSRIRKDFA